MTDYYTLVENVAKNPEIIDELVSYMLENGLTYPPYELCKNVLTKYVYNSLTIAEMNDDNIIYKIRNAIGANYIDLGFIARDEWNKLSIFTPRPASDAKEHILDDCYFRLVDGNSEVGYKVKNKKREYMLLQLICKTA